MKRNIIKTAAFAFCTLLTLGSCGDFLEAENKTGIDADPYFTDAEGQAALRVNMYNCMKPLVTEIDLNEWGTDLYMTVKSDPGVLHKYEMTPENSTVESYYKKCYSLINQSNCMIKYAGDNEQYKAEGIFFRNYGYYLLTQHFGAVPYVTDFIETSKKDYPRKPLAEIYPALIADLEGIMNSSALPETDNEHKGYVSRAAVKTLLAKVCLAAGWDLETSLNDALQGTYTINGTAYFTKAATYAAEVIGSQQLTMPFEEKWSPRNEGNAEEIFAVQYQRAGFPGDELTGGHGLQNNYGCQLGDPLVQGLKTSSGSHIPSKKAIYLYTKEDERWNGTFMTTIYNYYGNWPKTGYYAYYNASAAELANTGVADMYFGWWTTEAEVRTFVKEHPGMFVQGSAPNVSQAHILAETALSFSFNASGNISQVRRQAYADHARTVSASVVSVKKFDDPTTTQVASSSNCYRDIVVFHLSDLYLTAAEAYLMAGNEAKALELVNAVRARAKATTLSSFADYRPAYQTSNATTAIDLLLDEKARECYAERCRWMDLRRTRQLAKYNVEFNTYLNSIADMSNVRGEVKWYRPIPAAEISANTGITEADQNPGY